MGVYIALGYFVIAGLLVLWGCVDDIRWRAHRVDPYDGFGREDERPWWYDAGD